MVVRNGVQLKTGIKLDNVKTKSVQAIIVQLIQEVTNITETFPLEKGQTPRHYMDRVEHKLGAFIDRGAQAINNCLLDYGKDLLSNALRDVEDAGQLMIQAGRDFAMDISNSKRRATATQAGQQLLEMIANFLIVADSVDVSLIIHGISKFRQGLEGLRKAESSQEVVTRYNIMMSEIIEIEESVRRRVGDLKNPVHRDDLMAARGLLKTSCPLVYATTKAFVRHPETEDARFNRDYAHKEAMNALNSMEAVLRGESPDISFTAYGQLGNLIGELENFQNRVYMEPGAYKKHIHRPELEEMLERIVSGSAVVADSGSTRNDRKTKIVDGCNDLRQALQGLLTEYERNCGRTDPSEDVDLAMVLVGRKAKDLRRHLRRAVVDHVSDAFLDTTTPLLSLIEAAKTRSLQNTQNAALGFTDHAQKIVAVAHLVCEMSTDTEGVKIIRYTASQIDKLAPEVVRAAFLLCTHGDSAVAKENMDVFRDSWLEKVRLLTMAIDSIISLDDFLAVSEAHIADDAMLGLKAIHDGDGDILDRAAGAIRGRSLRVCSTVDTEMDALQASMYTEKVKMATKKLRDDILNEFATNAEKLVTRVTDQRDVSQQEINQDSEEFIQACTLVHEAVKQIRNALLMNRDPEDVDSDNEYNDDGHTMVQDNASRVSEGENQQKLMRRLPEEDKKKIQEQIDVFKITQTKFEREVAKWDETGNDIIILAKHMNKIMMNMTDFTRGRGPLKTTMDVIRAAQEISDAGAKLMALATAIGDESADSETRKDLLAYISRIPLFCQQLNICSKVKADVQQVGDELVVSGLESVTTLIQTSRNLLGTVVLIVKSAYIASTKFHRTNVSAPRMEWHMAKPKKQPLVRPAQKTNQGIIRRVSERRPLAPAKALAEFVH